MTTVYVYILYNCNSSNNNMQGDMFNQRRRLCKSV